MVPVVPSQLGCYATGGRAFIMRKPSPNLFTLLGLGITNAACLAAGVTVMAVVVVLFNRSVWKRLYRMTEERFSLSK